MSRFDEKRVLITGGTSGIGLATARRIQREGGRVAVTGTNAKRLASAAAEGFLALRNDAGEKDAAGALAAWVEAELGHLDAVFLNAGFGRFLPLEHVSADEFDEEFAVNVRGPLLQSQALAPLIAEGGTITINSSVINTMGMASSAVYAATKAAVRSMVRVLARELAPRGIRVNAVSPGPVSTNFFARTGMNEEQVAAFGQMVLASVPLGRFGTTDEIAAVASFLLSDEASFVTGSEYVVDGGISQL